MKYKHDHPTIGVLAGWQAHAGTPDSFLHQVFHGVHAAARDMNCNLLLAYGIGAPRGRGMGRLAWPLFTEEADFVPVGTLNVDGLIVAPPIVTPEKHFYYGHFLKNQDYPIVFAGSGEPGASVVPDNAKGIHQAMAHLVAHGHQHIAFVAGDKDRKYSDSAYRLEAYRACLEEYGLMYTPDLIAYSAHTIVGGRQAMAEILRRQAHFSAVVASNDLAAVGAMEVLKAAGVSVPEDIALIGFDDRVEARATIPQLTTVHYPIFELGYQAMLLLLKYVNGEIEDPMTLRVQTHLVIRESCGCLAGKAVGMPSQSSGLVNQQVSSPAEVPARHPNEVVTQIIAALVQATFNETHRLSLDESRLLCGRLVTACYESLLQSKTEIFHLEVQKTLEKVVLREDDLHGWQVTISMLREWLPALRKVAATDLSDHQIESMLHQARVLISEVGQGQRARYLIHQDEIVNQMSLMTARFHAAQDEEEVFTALTENLPKVGIRHATVAFYEPEGDDPVAWSVVRAVPANASGYPQRFPSREFPPKGLYAEDEVFHLALLPVIIQENLAGFIAFDMGNLGLCADITRQLVAALRGVRLYRAAVEGQRLAEEANRLKSRFLSMISHELRTPLNLISGLSDLLLRESEDKSPDVDSGMREDLERIYVNAQHLDGLIRDVLDLARSEVGQLQLVREPLDIYEVLEPISVIAQQLVQEKSLMWRTEISEALPYVLGDRTRLQQVLLNLVNNAVKFTAQGSVELRAVVEDEMVHISVKDTGLGIPPEEQSVIFDEFRQSERTSARGYGGMGLGLAICKRLIEMHEGEIGVRSSGEEGEGSEFYVTLPAMAQPVISSACERVLQTSQRVVLLVHDQEKGHPLQTQWRQEGIDIVLQSVAQSNTWLFAVLAQSPDAIILDQDVAAQWGWEVLKTLKQHPETRHVPVLFVREDDEVDQGALLEVNFLTKPVGTAELGEALIAQGLLVNTANAPAEKKILIVDDDPGILDMHTRIVQLQSPAYEVLQARDGYEALKIIRETCPDLVLLDLMMPGLDGFGVLEAMRDHVLSRDIPVIILTAQTLTEEDMARLNQGMVSVLSKGLFTVEETLQHLEQVLARQRKSVSDAQQFTLKAMAYMHTHYMEAISRSDIAAYVGLSERHLARCFRKETGLTLIAYLNRYRVKQAKRLLEMGDMGVTDVAMAVGFSSGGYFSRVFRQEIGVSPLAYQQGERGSATPEKLA